MADVFKDFYSGAANCINTSFCLDGGSYDSSNLEMPRTLKIRIVANPNFWGFGSLSGNTLIEGWGTFKEGYFDFYDSHEPDHSALKTCGDTTLGPFTNEQRPDVGYRSVYDPENGNSHYNFTTQDDVIRGGAENYLLDRVSEQSSDAISCDTTDPTTVFKTNPAGYGLNPKILFNNKVYKNNTGAWRIEECDICYDTTITNAMRVYDCSGSPKQHINADGNFANLYDPFQSRCLASGFSSESECTPDGVTAQEYGSSGSSIIRSTGLSIFLEYTFQYDNGAATGLRNGQAIGINNSEDNDGVITIFDVVHNASNTTAYAVGSNSSVDYSDSGGFDWIAFDTYDPSMCCGGAAYGVDSDTKQLTNVPLYHIDIGRVFNNPKNKIYSNRIDRSYGGFSVDRAVDSEVSRRDYSYVAVNEDGNALLVASGAIHNVDLACETGIWDATATHIYQLGDTYSTESGVGSIALATDSGFAPLFPKELPYYGAFYDVDRWDNNIRSPEGGNREVNRNATCYTKTGSLSVYPDCLSQWTRYTNCDPVTKYTLNNIPRLSIVYRGCDYDDPCTFDDSGRPWTAGASGHPSSMNDLIRGFGGQEIQMFINLGTARAAEIKREPCCCLPPPCPGTSPPEYVLVDSPVTFPCFPKFDLDPSGYGCQDPIYYLDVMNQLGLDTDPSVSCSIPYYDACTPKQPYTTYGYIRNLCGKETNSRRDVIDSLATKLHTGDYQDVTFSDNTVEPMYVAFDQDTPNCCSPSGFPVGSTECDPSLLSFDTYGSGATAEMVIGTGGAITYNVLSSGSGYQFGGAAVLASGSTSPTQTIYATFDAANDGLSAVSGIPGTGTPFNTTIGLNIIAGGSGVAGSGGFSYNACDTGGLTHYWGLTDFQGRLALPYFNTKANSTTICGNGNHSYIDYDSTGTLAGDWPKDEVPFLVEIDHEEYCTSCSTTQMPTGDLILTVSSLPTKFAHNQTSDVNTGFGVYGWNHCQYEGSAKTPQYNASTDTWTEHVCETGDGLALTAGVAYTGETCACCDTSFPMKARILEGTNVPIGYVTYDTGNINNSYLPFGNCGSNVPTTRDEDLTELTNAFTVYMKASMGCSSDLYSSAWNNGGLVGGLGGIYGCDGTCATSFPAPNSSPDLDLDFFFVRNDFSDIFESLDDKTIFNDIDFLENGLVIQSVSEANHMENITPPVTITCGGESGTLTNVSKDACGGWTSTDSIEDFFQIAHCVNGNKNTIQLGLNLTGCIGSRVVIYGCNSYDKGVYEKYKEAGNPKFGGSISTIGYTLDGCPVSVPSDTGSHCSWNAHFTANHAAAATGDYSLSAASKYDCKDYKDTDCCLDYDESSRFSRKQIEDSFEFGFDGRGCYCEDPNNWDIVYDVTKQTITHPVTSGQTTGWYGTPFFQSTSVSTSPNTIYWSGENIPGIGNIGPLPLGKMIALNYQNETLQTITNFAGDSAFYNSISVEPACAFHTGPNRETQIGAQLFEPYRSTTFLNGTPNLQPERCTTSSGTLDGYYSSCGQPVPFTTYGGGLGETITVNKKSCWPEIMTVHKIECDASGYKLHVSREYFEHDRTWYYYAPDQELVTRYGLIEGGEDSLRYECDETYLSCLDPGTGVSPDILDYSFALKMMTPSDGVTPVYPTLCATGTEPFVLTSGSAINGNSNSVYSTSNCDLYPNIKGQQFFNYYNALYDSGNPGAGYLTDAGAGVYREPPDPDLDCNESYPHDLVYLTGNIDPVFSSTGDIQYSHSCIQDALECGGGLWCNKEFFPRRSYAKNTRITRFGALSICTQNSQLESPDWYSGHGTTWDDSPNKEALATSSFVDACDNDAVVLLADSMGIDDNVLYIPFQNSSASSPSLLSLMGAIHPGFKANLNEKTCVYADSGDCLTFLPEHNDTTIDNITFSADEYGYYLNDLISSGGDNCLFSPFKIMMDVECCADRIGHKGTSDPTNLNYIATIPSSVCKGWVDEPVCVCDDTTNSCSLYDYGHDIPGFSCITGMYWDEVFASGTCEPACVVPGSGTQTLWVQYEDSPGIFVDGINNSPLSLFSSHEPNALIGGLESSAPFCQDDCSGVHNYEAGAWFDDVFTWNGRYFINPVYIYMDGFSHSGVYWRFPNAVFGDTNCCYGPSGATTAGDIHTGGCNCAWTICDMQKALRVSTSNTGEFSNYTGSESDGTILDTVGFLNSFGCVDFDTVKACVFPSVVQFTVTEDI
jgi:hypothetical protein